MSDTIQNIVAAALGPQQPSTMIDRLNDIWRDDDHGRLCQGREYSCTCGFDERTLATAKAAADHIETLEAALRTIQSAVPKYLKKEMTAEEFALVVIGEVDSAKVNKAFGGRKCRPQVNS